MAEIDKIRADLVINGGGFMGLALARQALLRGLIPVVIEKNQPQRPHYMSKLLAPRADYLSLDIDEVELTAHACIEWLEMFSDIVRPKLFIMPFSSNSRYSYDFLEPVMVFYDKLTSTRLGNHYKPHFRINNMVLEQMEPNLRKGCFNEALGFYELMAEPDILLNRLKKEIMFRHNSNFIFYPDRVVNKLRGGRIESVELFFNDRNRSFLIENPGSLTVVNCAGPWMQDSAQSLGLNLPVKYSLGFQLSVKGRGLFQHSIITFGADGKYAIISQGEDYVQIGPTNTSANGPEDIDNPKLQEKAIKYLSVVLKDTIEPGIRLTKASIRSGGLRVKLKLPLVPDSNRPFTMNIGFENYHVLYPGKAVLALRTADEFLDKVIDNKKLLICLDGNKKIGNVLRLNFVRLKSLIILGRNLLINYLIRLGRKN